MSVFRYKRLPMNIEPSNVPILSTAFLRGVIGTNAFKGPVYKAQGKYPNETFKQIKDVKLLAVYMVGSFFNHSDNFNVSNSFFSAQKFTAKRDIKKGEQLTIDYLGAQHECDKSGNLRKDALKDWRIFRK